MKYSYLFFNFVVVFSSLAGVLLYKNGKLPEIKRSIISIMVSAIVFIVWDSIVTGLWWNFNSQRVLGFTFVNIPLEELIFFISVPWSCLVIWENLKARISGRVSVSVEWLMIMVLAISSYFSWLHELWYTLTVCIGLVVLSVLSLVTGKWLRNKVVVVFGGTVTFLTVVFNNFLTTFIVTYNSSVISGIRIGTMPIEDLGYGILLLTAVVGIYEYQKK